MISTPGPDQIANAVQVLTEAAQASEHRFQAIARRLEDGLGLLAEVQDGFDRLKRQWEAADVGEAERDLRLSIEQVGQVMHLQRRDGEALDELVRLVGGMPDDVRRLAAPIEYIVTLAVNARLSCVDIGATDPSIFEFADQIAQTARRMRTCVAGLNGMLAALQTECTAADEARAGLPPSDATEAILRRAGQMLGGSGARRGTTARAVEAVRHGADAMQRRIIDAVRAMQLGDITRQRIEHVQQIAHMLTQPPAGTPTSMGWTIAAAHLHETAGDLDREAARIASSLAMLGEDAQEITSLSHAAFGATAGGYLGTLQAEVMQVGTALGALRDAAGSAEDHLHAARQATADVVGQIAELRNIEIEIHLTGLNASFRCGRLGNAGRQLSVIAQMVRQCGRQFAGLSQAMRDRVANISAATDRFADAQRHDTLQGIGPLEATISGAVQRLSEADRTQADALQRLDANSASLSTMLAKAIAAFSVREEIGNVLRQSAEQMDFWARTWTEPSSTSDSAALHLIDRIGALYTMDRERVLHANITGSPLPKSESTPAASADNLEAMFL